MIFISILLIFSIYVISVAAKRWRQINYLGKTFPIPRAVPFFGVLLNFPRDPVGIFETIRNLRDKYGSNILWWGPFYQFSLFITDPNDVETILANSSSKKAKKSDDYDRLVPWLGTGLLTSWGQKWFQRRKIITPSFHFSILEQFVEVFNHQSDIFLDKLAKIQPEIDYDIYTDVTHFTLDVICEASMGVKLGVQSQPDSEYAIAVKDMSELFQKRMFHVFKDSRFLYELVASPKRSEKELITLMHKFTNSVITERRKSLLQDNHKTNERPKNRMSFLDMLLHATVDGKPLSDEDIREEVDTFMFEGHDTTASGISFAIYHLSRNSDVQEKLYSELKEVLGPNCSNKEITYKELNNLTYLDMVIKETLRITPSVPFIGRELTEDTKLGGTIVPSGVGIILGLYNMQNSPDYFPNPEKFDPDRFLEQTKHPFVYTPFSAGPRNCIGQKFAVLEMKTILTKIISNYKLLPAGGKAANLVLQADLILKSANGINIRLQKR